MAEHRPDRRPEPEALERVEQLLRSALAAEAAAVTPSLDGLHRIRAAIETPTPERTGRWVRVGGRSTSAAASPRRYWLPSLAAAAAIGVMALAAPHLVDVRGAAPASVAAIGSGAAPASGTQAPAPVVEPLPVYYTTEQQGRWALVREFEPTTLTDPARRLAEAVRLAVAGRSTDPDYTSVWRSALLTTDTTTGLVDAVSVRATGEGIEIRLDPALVRVRSRAISTAQSRLAVQQLIWTATATAQQTVPVRITSTDGSPWLFGRVRLSDPFERTLAEGDPRAPVWVNSIVDGQRLGTGTATIVGDVAAGSGPVGWRLRRVTGDAGSGTGASPTTEDAGSGTADVQASAPSGSTPAIAPTGTPDAPARIVWTAHLTLSAPGTYLLDVGIDGWTDTKTLVVR